MPISWSDAVHDADSADDLGRYHRAVEQVRELDPLVKSFIQAVDAAGKWPTSPDDTFSSMLVHGGLQTRHGAASRHVWCTREGQWGLNTDKKGLIFLADVPLDGPPRFGVHEDVTRLISSRDFGRLMDEMERTKDWVPRELVGALRELGVPIPSD